MEQIFKYKDNQITFKKGDSLMVNATEMARPFGKNPAKFLDNPTRTMMLLKLCQCNARNIHNMSDIDMPISLNKLSNVYPESIKVVKGNYSSGLKQGTWLHEDIALD